MPLVASKHLGISTSLPIGTIAEVSKGLKTSNIPSLPARLSGCMPCRPTTSGRFAALPSDQGRRWLYIFTRGRREKHQVGNGPSVPQAVEMLQPKIRVSSLPIESICKEKLAVFPAHKFCREALYSLPALVGRALWPYPCIPRNTLKYVKMVVLIILKI